MKITKYIVILFLLSSLFYSCVEDKTEYPGSIIISNTFLSMPGSLENERDARFYIYSGSSYEEDLGAVPAGDWTYELWLKADSDCLVGDRTASNGSLANGASISERAYNFELYLVDDDDADFSINYGRLNGLNDQVATMQSHDSEVNLFFDEWIHVAISRSSTDNIAKFYINGVLIDSSDDSVWIQPSHDKYLDINYMYRGGDFMNFFKGSMDNVRVSKIDRYPTEFTPNRNLKYNEVLNDDGDIEIFEVDEHTLVQLDLEKHLTPHSDPDFKIIDLKGSYEPTIQIHNDYFNWETEIINEYPVSGY